MLAKSSYLGSIRLGSKYIKNFLFVHNIEMPDLLLNKLKAIAEIIKISGYKSISRGILLSFLNESKLEKESEKNFDGAIIEYKIKKQDRLKTIFLI